MSIHDAEALLNQMLIFGEQEGVVAAYALEKIVSENEICLDNIPRHVLQIAAELISPEKSEIIVYSVCNFLSYILFSSDTLVFHNILLEETSISKSIFILLEKDLFDKRSSRSNFSILDLLASLGNRCGEARRIFHDAISPLLNILPNCSKSYCTRQQLGILYGTVCCLMILTQMSPDNVDYFLELNGAQRVIWTFMLALEPHANCQCCTDNDGKEDMLRLKHDVVIWSRKVLRNVTLTSQEHIEHLRKLNFGIFGHFIEIDELKKELLHPRPQKVFRSNFIRNI